MANNTNDLSMPEVVNSIPKEPTTKKNEKSQMEKLVTKSKKKIAEVHQDVTQQREEILKLSSGIMNQLDPQNLIINDVSSGVKLSSSIMSISGDTKKNQAIDRTINEAVAYKSSKVSLYNTTGLYYKMQQANYNQFLLENLPVLEQSIELFIDDVNNGSYRGNEFEKDSKFKFYKKGIEVTDLSEREKLMELLVPTAYSNIAVDEKSYFDIDTQSDKTAWGQGYSLTYIISNKEVAKELYVRYILKKKKAEELQNKKIVKKMILNANESFYNNTDFRQILKRNKIKYTYSKGSWYIIDNPDKKRIDKAMIDSMEGLNSSDYRILEYYIEDGIYKQWTPVMESELKATNESFLDFVSRWNNNELNSVYVTDTNPEKACFFNFVANGIPFSAMANITDEINEIFKGTTEDVLLESVSDDILKSLDTVNFTFEDIYNTPLDRCGNSSLKTAFESIINDFNYEVAMEDITVASRPPLSPQELNGNDPTQAPIVSDEQNPETGVNKEVEEKIKETNRVYSKLDRMFSSIKGESVEYLENNRLVPVITGNRLIGTFYNEYTHQDIQHYIGLRSFIGNPQSFQQNGELVDILEDQQEETVGRMIFGDVIKPIIEKNIDVKFLKNNEELLYTLKKLIEENEVSNSMSVNELAQNNMYNLSRIIYIPAKDLIFKRNGISGLGKSKLDQASVPATAAILANECQLAWYITASGGYSVVRIAKGLNDNKSEYMQGSLMDRFYSLGMDRIKLRDVSKNNFELGHKFIVIESETDQVQPLELNPINPPDFSVPPDVIRQWVEQAGDIVGYNPAVFSSQDGQIELATKLHEINNSKMIQIQKFREFKARPSSQLATMLVRLRGGEAYQDYTVEWIPPSIEKPNQISQANAIKDKTDAFLAYLDLMDKLHEKDKNWDQDVQRAFKDILLKKIAGDDSVIAAFDDMLEEAFLLANVEAAKTARETASGSSKKKSKKKEEDEDEEAGDEA